MGGRDPARFNRAAGFPEVVFKEDRAVPLTEAIDRPLPKCPVEAGLRLHWLAVRGQVPAVAENAPVGGEARAKIRGEGKAAPVVAPVEHVLPEELQLYFERSSEVLLGEDDQARALALASLSQDPGLHPLAPYYTKLVSDRLRQQDTLQDLATLRGLLDIIWGLTSNPSVDIEVYLHRLLPVVLTCLVGANLGPVGGDHWALRQAAARTLQLICQKLQGSDSFYNIQSRVVKTLLSQGLLDPRKGLTSHYGAIVGLGTFGGRVVRHLLLPNLEKYIGSLQAKLGEGGAGERHEAGRVWGALVRCCGTMMHKLLVEEERLASRGLKPKFREREAGAARDAAPAKGLSDDILGDRQLEADCRLLVKLFGEAILPFLPTPELSFQI
mmetsp:Transcript_17553/g.49379  ORF Transcript_17553/g.49379 Transcript_17553/m.49379 type:complete len:383 (-) Transcript_17553:284-1432(-)